MTKIHEIPERFLDLFMKFDKIVTKGFYSEADGASIISSILQAMYHVHSQNIVHYLEDGFSITLNNL